MPRQTLATLISKVRSLIDDPAGAGQVFTDDQIQDALDARREEARYYNLNELESIAPGGTTTYVTFESDYGNWEDGASLVDSTYTVLTPATSDLANARWTFSTEPLLPVMISGFTYDVYGSSGDLLLQRATREADSFDVSADGLTLSRSQKAVAYRERAYEYLAKARTRQTHTFRSDEA